MAGMPIFIDDNLSIDESEFQIVFIRSSGPGGQNVNKTASKAQLRFDITRSQIPLPMKERLYQVAGKRINERGELVIDAQRFRTQEQNRVDAILRLTRLLKLVSSPPPQRLKTRPPPLSRQRRLESKQRRAMTKRLRRRPSTVDGDY